MIVRKVVKEDLEAVERLVKGVENFNEEEVATAIDLVTQSVDAPQNGYETLVAVEKGNVLGFICFGRTPLTEQTFDLYWIAVGKDHRKKGVGKALHEAFIACIRERQGRLVRVETSTKPSYTATLKFYEALGYETVAVIDNFYRDGDSLCTFVLRLS
jgi:ribosomal protein S18 acetylase RimI-like enzyme